MVHKKSERMRIYILNIRTPYNKEETGLNGKWFTCPTSFETLRKTLGIEQESQMLILDYELPFQITENISLEEINIRCNQIFKKEDC